MATIPVTNEQPGIAARVAWVGAGEATAHKHLTRQVLRAAIIRVQLHPSYRAAAERIRGSVQADVGASRATELIEQSLGLKARLRRPTDWANGFLSRTVCR